MHQWNGQLKLINNTVKDNTESLYIKFVKERKGKERKGKEKKKEEKNLKKESNAISFYL